MEFNFLRQFLSALEMIPTEVRSHIAEFIPDSDVAPDIVNVLELDHRDIIDQMLELGMNPLMLMRHHKKMQELLSVHEYIIHSACAVKGDSITVLDIEPWDKFIDDVRQTCVKTVDGPVIVYTNVGQEILFLSPETRNILNIAMTFPFMRKIEALIGRPLNRVGIDTSLVARIAASLPDVVIHNGLCLWNATKKDTHDAIIEFFDIRISGGIGTLPSDTHAKYSVSIRNLPMILEITLRITIVIDRYIRETNNDRIQCEWVKDTGNRCINMARRRVGTMKLCGIHARVAGRQ